MGWSGLLAKRRIQIVLLVFVLALALLFLKDLNPMTFDANMGIEFVGGVRVPISLERSVDSETMQSMVDTIKIRINAHCRRRAVELDFRHYRRRRSVFRQRGERKERISRFDVSRQARKRRACSQQERSLGHSRRCG